jgi:hypothetical protein
MAAAALERSTHTPGVPDYTATTEFFVPGT